MVANKQQNSNKPKSRTRVYLTFNQKQIELIDTLVGEIGDDRADIVKTIFMNWLSEKNITPAFIKKRMKL